MASYTQNTCVNPRELVCSQPQFPDTSSLGRADLHYPPPTPQSIMNGEYCESVSYPTRVEYVPLSSKYCREPPSFTIPFTVQGTIGPCLYSVLRREVTIDGAYLAAFKAYGWSMTKWTFDWPGLKTDRMGLWCHNNRKEPLTCDELIREIGTLIVEIMRKSRKGDPKYRQSNDIPHCWRFENINLRDIRFVSLNYYKGVWVPILAVTRY
ncbi:uncharacterized protein EV420DRAFT_1644914 [Desarmillaria tabescens]|uniref:Uncharacterized protein n=1 Tax=Armillaria tabescens TaxID=1929756 RepID=A0AA39K8J8_ARMTA|nr:uncharacterized protein EV420DRAFT_1644914 [Desarmillaria tabescens]KAK0455276.1 hypothetical protein EV420DRAFT_1644914 [Desarmillaria tabescens]